MTSTPARGAGAPIATPGERGATGGVTTQPRREPGLIALVVAALLVVSTVWGAQVWLDRFEFGQDAALYAEMGHRIATGDPHAGDLGGTAPATPLAIAALEWVGLAPKLAFRVAAFGLHFALVGAVFLFARMVSERLAGQSRICVPAALATATLWGTSGYVVWLGAAPTTDQASVAALLVGLALVGRAARHRRAASVVGVCAAMAYLCRFASLPFAAVFLAISVALVLRSPGGSGQPGRVSQVMRLLLPTVVAVLLVGLTYSRPEYGVSFGIDTQIRGNQVKLAHIRARPELGRADHRLRVLNEDGTFSVCHTDPGVAHPGNLQHALALESFAERTPVPSGPQPPNDAVPDTPAHLGRALAGSTSSVIILGCSACWLLGLLLAPPGRRSLDLVPVAVCAAGAAAAGLVLGSTEPRYLWILATIAHTGPCVALCAAAGRMRSGLRAVSVTTAVLAILVMGAWAATNLLSLYSEVSSPQRRDAARRAGRAAELLGGELRLLRNSGHGGPVTVCSSVRGVAYRHGARWLPLPIVLRGAAGAPSGEERARWDGEIRSFLLRGDADLVLLTRSDRNLSPIVSALLWSERPLPAEWEVVEDLSDDGGVPAIRILRRRRTPDTD